MSRSWVKPKGCLIGSCDNMVQEYCFLIMSQKRWSESGLYLLVLLSFSDFMWYKDAFYMLQGSRPSGQNLCICPQSLIGSDWVMCLSPISLRKMRWAIGLDQSGHIFGIGGGLILPNTWVESRFMMVSKGQFGVWMLAGRNNRCPHKHEHLLHFCFFPR